MIVEGSADVLRTGTDFNRAIDLLTAKYPQYRTMDLRADGAVLRLRADRILAWRASDDPAA